MRVTRDPQSTENIHVCLNCVNKGIPVQIWLLTIGQSVHYFAIDFNFLHCSSSTYKFTTLDCSDIKKNTRHVIWVISNLVQRMLFYIFRLKRCITDTIKCNHTFYHLVAIKATTCLSDE